MSNLEDLTPIYNKHKGNWVAINPKSGRVLASSKSAKVVYKKSQTLGVKEPILFKVPRKNTAYVG